MTSVRLPLPTVLMLVAVVGAGAFAAGQALSANSSSASSSIQPSPAAKPQEATEQELDTPEVPLESDQLPPGHPPTSGPGAVAAAPLPLGHPSVDPMGQAAGQMAVPEPPAQAQTPLEWQVPARWKVVPNANTFRLATCRVPRAPGDTDDAELSVTRALGSVDANVDRWIGQFDAEGQKTAKRTTRMVGALEVTIVEVHGTYSAGMAMGKGAPSSGSGWVLLGAIVATPGAAHFFKLTGPAKTVLAARSEFDGMVASLVQR